jgi:hypothetical protein
VGRQELSLSGLLQLEDLAVEAKGELLKLLLINFGIELAHPLEFFVNLHQPPHQDVPLRQLELQDLRCHQQDQKLAILNKKAVYAPVLADSWPFVACAGQVLVALHVLVGAADVVAGRSQFFAGSAVQFPVALQVLLQEVQQGLLEAEQLFDPLQHISFANQRI